MASDGLIAPPLAPPISSLAPTSAAAVASPLQLEAGTSAKDADDEENLGGANSTNKETDLLLVPSVNGGLKEHHHRVQFNNNNNNDSNRSSRKSDSLTTSSSSSSSSSSSEESIELAESRPPDGGWGWVIVAASFFVNLVADGVTLSFGVIFVEFKDYFGENRGKTAWIGSLFMAMPLLSGPIASFLTDRYGCRRVTIAGSILASAGFVISSTANSMEVLFLTFGVLAGFGLSLCYVASVVIVAYYFDKRRSFATGLAVCGSGIGTFIFAPLTQALISEYGWRGTTLILAGLFLNLTVCGALMRDLPWTPSHKAKKQRKLNKALKKRHLASSDTVTMLSHNGDTLADHHSNGNNGLHPIRENEDLFADDEERGGVKDVKLSSSLVNLPTYVRNGEKVPLEVIELLSSHKQVYNVLMQNYPSLLTPSRSFSDSGRLNEATHLHNSKFPALVQFPPSSKSPPTAMSPPIQTPPSAKSPLSTKSPPLQSPPLQSPPFQSPPLQSPLHQSPPRVQSPLALNSTPPMCADKANTDSAYLWWLKRNQITPPRLHAAAKKTTPTSTTTTTAYLRDLRVHRLSLTYRGAMLNINRYRLRASSCPDIYRNSMTTIAKEKNEWQMVLKEFCQLIVDMFDFSHFADPKFLLFAISNFLLYTWYDVPYVYIADYAQDTGFNEEDASMLIGIIGIVNTFGEVILGWAGDRPWINASFIYAISMGFCGAVIALVPLFKSYWSLATVSGLFGLFIAANYSLTCIILVELITLEKFTNAYGLLLMVQGVANLIGPPLGGWLCDMTGTYDLSFYLAGIFIAISGVMLLILPAARRYKRFQTLQRQVRPQARFYEVLASCLTGKVDIKEPVANHV